MASRIQVAGSDPVLVAMVNDTLKVGTISSASWLYDACMEGVFVPATSKLVMQSDTFSFQINEKAISERLALCKFSLIVKIVLSKGKTPWKLLD